MKTPFFSVPTSRRGALVVLVMISVSLLVGAKIARAENVPALLDDFSDAHSTKNGTKRFVVTDKTIGGQSQATQRCENGVLSVQGDLVPARGQPAFVSLISLLSADAQPHDLSNYEGVRLRVKVTQGILCVQVGSADIQNYDYHTSAPLLRNPDQFEWVKIPFKAMKRAWSEQIPLNLKVVTSINLVAVGMAKDSFAYEVDEVGFY